MNFMRSGCYLGIFSTSPHHLDVLCHNVTKRAEREALEKRNPGILGSCGRQKGDRGYRRLGGRESVC